MKKHQLVNGRLLQSNKKFSHLKEHQKEQISQWLYEVYRSSSVANGQSPAGENNDDIIAAVMEKITDAGIWIPEGEIVAYYHRRKMHFQKRFTKENNPCDIVSLSEGEIDAALEKGYSDYIAGRSKPAKEVFAELHNSYITPD